MDVKISIIVENYVRHYLYLAPDLYEELFGGAPDYNQLLMKYQTCRAIMRQHSEKKS